MGSSDKQKKKEAGATPLTRDQVAERFEARYQLAVKSMVGSIDADAAILRTNIVQALNSGKPKTKEDAEAMIDTATKAFCKSRPNSLLTKYIQNGGNVIDEWSFDDGRASVKIASANVKKEVNDNAAVFRKGIFSDDNIYDAQRPRVQGVTPTSYQSIALVGFAGEVGRELVSMLPPLMSRPLRIGESEPKAKDPVPNVLISLGTYSSPAGTHTMNDNKPCIKVTNSG